MGEGLVGPYSLQARLGKGAHGEVFRAFDTRRRRTVALKLLLPADGVNAVEEARFRRECELAAQLASPHVIPIHDFGVVDGYLFLDMRLVDGGDLRRLLTDARALPAGRAVEIVRQVAEALDAAHASGLVHRDVKPANVLVSTQRNHDFVYLADFGVVRPLDPRRTRITDSGLMLGTVPYMAPETFSGHPASTAVDVYALGCLLFECLTGRTPFQGQIPELINSHLHAAPPSLSTFVPDVPSSMDAVIAVALAKNPAARFPSAGELAAAATAAIESSSFAPGSGPTIFGVPQAGAASTANSVRAKPRELHRFAHPGRIYASALSADGLRVATVGEDRCLRIWDTVSGDEVSQATLERPLTRVVISPNGRWVATGYSLRSVGVWATDTGRLVTQVRHDNPFSWRNLSRGAITALAFNRAGDRLATSCLDTRVWELPSGNELSRMRHAVLVADVAFSSDGGWIVTGSSSDKRRHLRFWDIASGAEVGHRDCNSSVSAVKVSPDGARVGFVCEYGAVAVVWDIEANRDVVRTRNDDKFWRSHSARVAFSHDGSKAVTASSDSTARVWDLVNERQAMLVKHDGRVLDAAFAPDGLRFATAGEDGTARIWNVGTGEELARIGHDAAVLRVRFSPDGNRLLTSGAGLVPRLWSL